MRFDLYLERYKRYLFSISRVADANKRERYISLRQNFVLIIKRNSERRKKIDRSIAALSTFVYYHIIYQE